MAQAFERLYRLTVDATQANRQLSQIGKNTQKLSDGFARIQRAAGAAFSAFGTIQGLTGLTRAQDQIELLGGSFLALTEDGDRANDMLQRVFRTVADTGASLEDTSSTFQRLTIGFQELGGTNAQIDAVANTFIKLGRVSGTSMFDTNAALIQFSQGLASGKLQGDELRSIMERLPLITQLIADEYSRVNGNITITRGMVKQLGREGKISAEIMGNALLNASEEVATKFELLVFTLEQELNSLKSTATQILADLSANTGIGDALKAGISGLNQALVDVRANMGQFVDDMSKLVTNSDAVKVGLIAVSWAIYRSLIPAIVAAYTASVALVRANPLIALAALSTVAVLAFVKNWDSIRLLFLYEVPSWIQTLLGTWNSFLASMSIGTQKLWNKLKELFIGGINGIIGRFNTLSERIQYLSSGKISIGKIDLLALDEADAAVSDFTAAAAENFAKAEELTLQYTQAMSKLGVEAEKTKDKLNLFGGDGSTEEDKGAAKALEDMAKGMADLQNQVLNTLDPMRELSLLMDELHTLMTLGLLSEDQVNAYIDSLDGTTEATEKAAEATKKAAEEWAAYGQTVADAVDPMNAMLRKFTEVDQAIEKGVITPEMGEAYKNILLDMEESTATSTDLILASLEEIKNATNGFARDFASTLVDGLRKGEFAFKDFAASILDTMAKIVFSTIFEKFFTMLLAGVNFSGFGGGGSSGTGGGIGPPILLGGAQTLGSGGSVTGSAVGVMQPPTYGHGASSGGSSGLVNVTVNNNAAVSVSTSERKNSNGGIDIDVLIEERVNKALSGGGVDKAMKSNYGISRRAF